MIAVAAQHIVFDVSISFQVYKALSISVLRAALIDHQQIAGRRARRLRQGRVGGVQDAIAIHFCLALPPPSLPGSSKSD